MAVDAVIEAAREARAGGAERFCMGAAWREPKDRDMDAICAMVREVRALGMETCMTLGMLTDDQAGKLAEAGLDYYHHNLDTSPAYYENVVSNRTYGARTQNLERVSTAVDKPCCDRISGPGATRDER